VQYAILIYEPETDFDARSDPERAASYRAPYETYVAMLRESGVLVGGEVLRHPATATTVRLREGTRQVQDGPLPQSREQLGGFLIVEAPDLDAALAWAARCPAASTGGVEVRPIGMDEPG
jgi:hypothetical protein